MTRSLLFLFFLLLSGFELLAQSYGLAFNSHEAVQERRTSLDLSPADSLCFTGTVQLDFDLNILSGQHVYFGYILRMLNHNQNLDLICTQNSFKMVLGQQMTGIEFSIDTNQLYKNWTRISIIMDRSAKTLELKVNAVSKGKAVLQLAGNCFQFLWGANDHYRYNTRDLPPMRIRDIRISEGSKEKYYWSLADTSGNKSIDNRAGRVAQAKNAVWIKPRHQRWEQFADFVIGGPAAAAFDARTDRLIIAGNDSIMLFNSSNASSPDKWNSSPISLQFGNQAIFDSFTNKLYDLYIDQHKLVGWNQADGSWTGSFKDSLLTEYWHANKFISGVDTALYVIGGYGQLRYKNLVQRYSLREQRWDSIAVSGDRLTPRYLAALGSNAAGDTAYIIGGYGSPTGDQVLNPGYYYDMYRFEVKTKTFTRLFTIDSSNLHHVFANSLVLDADGKSFYALIFENGSFDTQLQLVKGSLSGGPLEKLGTPIPYSFYDVQSFADLYYSPRSRKLLAVSFLFSAETEKLRNTRVKLFSIDFPPEQIATLPVASAGKKKTFPWWALAGGLIAIIAIVALRIRKGQRRGGKMPAIDVATLELAPQPATADNINDKPTGKQISLFGQFQVTDREGADISKSFTPLLKELFLLVLIYTYRNGKGVSSEALENILWHDKAQKDAKNNRSVNLAKLKTILEKPGYAINTKDGGYYRFTDSEDGSGIDYRDFTVLTAPGHIVNKDYIRKLLRIIENGSFLPQTEYNWLDDIKSEVSNKVIDDGLTWIRQANQAEEAETIIECCNAIFHFDRCNEDALEYKVKALIHLKRHALANTSYLKFTKEYKEIYGEDFPKSFNEIIR